MTDGRANRAGEHRLAMHDEGAVGKGKEAKGAHSEKALAAKLDPRDVALLALNVLGRHYVWSEDLGAKGRGLDHYRVKDVDTAFASAAAELIITHVKKWIGEDDRFGGFEISVAKKGNSVTFSTADRWAENSLLVNMMEDIALKALPISLKVQR